MKPSPPARRSPQDNLGKETTPHTPSSVPLLCETPPHSREDAQLRVSHTHATRTTLSVHARQQWYQNNLIANAHFTSLKGWAVTQINKPPMFWSSPRNIIYFNHYQTSKDLGQQLMQSTNPVDHQESTFTARWATSPPYWESSQVNRG